MSQCIAVVIATYNRNNILLETVESVLKQNPLPEGWNYVLSIADDGSQDATCESLIKRYQLQPQDGHTGVFVNDRVILSTDVNKERGAARNRGARLAADLFAADWVMFLDSDDLLWPDTLAHFALQIQNRVRPESILIYANYQELWDGNKVGRFAFQSPAPEGDLRFIHLTRTLVTTGSHVIRMSAFQRVGGFSEMRKMSGSEDWHLWCRLAFEGPFLYSPHISRFYRRHEGCTTAREFCRSIQVAREDLIGFLREKLGPSSSIWIRKMLGSGNLMISGSFNSEHQSREAFRWLWAAVRTDFGLLGARRLWRHIVSCLWQMPFSLRIRQLVGREA